MGSELRVSYRKHSSGFGWEGCLRNGKAVAWACGHRHRNRDLDSFYGAEVTHRSAASCARKELDRRNRNTPAGQGGSNG